MSATRTGKKRSRLLVAEDDAVNQALLATFLEKWDHSVDVVSNGRDAVAAVRNKIYDLVFMDIEMPGLSGIDATRAIRALPDAHRRIPIIALTAHASLASHQECLAAGMNDYVAKPIDRTALAAALWRATDPTPTALTPAPTQASASAVSGSPARAGSDGPLDDAILVNLESAIGRELLSQLVLRHLPAIEARFTVLARIAPAGEYISHHKLGAAGERSKM